ncbi:MAG: hypothetical protein H6584_06420 [Flavobacteriales bacterium]|nr:hypothetical protein [Flavobacteriales bacterium]
MKNLELNEMEVVVGGGLRASDIVCGTLGLAYGAVNPWLGFGVSLACANWWVGPNPYWIG